MKNDSLALWKLKQGKTFLNNYLECARRIRKGEVIIKAAKIKKFIHLGLLKMKPKKAINSTNQMRHEVCFTLSGLSVYNQLSLLVNRGIIYQNDEGKFIWQNFQFVEIN
jgi:hypothetical protein